ncbi:MAG: Lrp/AsnC ligand binding domain-containing protein [Euryarchaeota archaeon]|nr:Lrp/AsnC ligand binding domain-containing protein [Euryarchaeota archaeon]
MTVGYVLVTATPTRELEVYGQLLKIKGAIDVCPVLGPVDFIVKMEADDHDVIAEIVLKKIRIISGVVSTKTFLEDEFLKNLQGLAEGA